MPIVPGVTDPVESAEDAARIAAEIGYPVAIKAAAGGGGKGIKVVRALGGAGGRVRRRPGGRVPPTSPTTRSISSGTWTIPGTSRCRCWPISTGRSCIWASGDCSIQRRHQKIVEETPSPVVTPELREAIGRIGVDAARAVGYTNAGTVEGLLAADGTYYFLEMNTRLQVEHTITEEVTGLDLVREQLRIAAGEPLGYGQEEVRLTGHSIQCRINAEDPARGFVPTPGLITRYREPSGPGVRVDSGVVEGSTISELYDPMVAKLVVWDQTRELARRRMLRALGEFEVGGVADADSDPHRHPRAAGVHRRRVTARLRRGWRVRGRPLGRTGGSVGGGGGRD